MKPFPRSLIPAITTRQWYGVRGMLHAGSSFTASALRAKSGMTEASALALILGMHTRGLCLLALQVYHACTASYVATRPYDTGFQPTPWVCPHCSERVSSADELGYALCASMVEDVELVP
jgi:hypothetical protein